MKTLNANQPPSTLISPDLRRQLAENQELGCGNFVHIAAATSPAVDDAFLILDRPCRSLSGERGSAISIRDVKEMADEYAAYYYGAGIRAKDPVAIYIDEGVENLIHYVALTGLGAIPVIVNGKMKPDIAAAFIEKAGAVALFTDRAHARVISHHSARNSDLRFIVTNESAKSVSDLEGELPAYYPFRHVANDVVLVGHSSGTTGIPKAVQFQHQQFFYGIRYRLGLPHAEGSERILSALPHSHSAGIAYVMLAMLAGTPVHILSDNSADHVLGRLEDFRATMVVAFPETFVGLSEAKLENYDLSSVRLWVNGGDAAHEAHIRPLIARGHRVRDGKQIPGSVFIDGLGSSEMGFSLFRMVHTPETDNYNRCIGASLDWVDAVVIGDKGEKLPPYQIGKLGVKSPSITPGYWNDSVLSARSTVNGYWLTGDMFFQDEKGLFYHVDRIPDVIHTPEGKFYSLQAEELLMKYCPDIADCTIVGAPVDESFAAPIAVVRLKAGVSRTPTDLLGALNVILKENGKRPLSVVVLATLEEIPLGPTGKVLKRELREQFRHFFKRSALRGEAMVPMHF